MLKWKLAHHYSYQIVLNKNYRYSKIFINIFAVNSVTKFTDSYKPVQYRWGQFTKDCESSVKKINKNSPQIWIMGNETVMFNITNGIYPYRLLYQSCVDSRKNRKQSLHVFQKESQWVSRMLYHFLHILYNSPIIIIIINKIRSQLTLLRGSWISET